MRLQRYATHGNVTYHTEPRRGGRILTLHVLIAYGQMSYGFRPPPQAKKTADEKCEFISGILVVCFVYFVFALCFDF